MKRILFLLLLTFMIIGCTTTEYVRVPVKIDVNFEPVPERDKAPERRPMQILENYLSKLVLYYSSLVKEWESWGISVFESVDNPLPESLLLIKNMNNEELLE